MATSFSIGLGSTSRMAIASISTYTACVGRRDIAAEEMLSMNVVRSMRRLIGSGVALLSGSSRQVFTHTFQYRLWGDGESLSGDGSALEQTKQIRSHLPDLFRRHRIRTLLDAPCGDFHWMKELHLTDGGLRRYWGVDVVPPLIEQNR